MTSKEQMKTIFNYIVNDKTRFNDIDNMVIMDGDVTANLNIQVHIFYYVISK